jgi:hypothetical protein
MKTVSLASGEKLGDPLECSPGSPRGGSIGGVMFRRKSESILITDAPESPARELRRREIRYVIMMSIRALCLIVAAILVSVRPPLVGLWIGLCVAGMVLLPWLAVILANDRPPRRRGEPSRYPSAPTQPALPLPRHPRVIDAADPDDQASDPRDLG